MHRAGDYVVAVLSFQADGNDTQMAGTQIYAGERGVVQDFDGSHWWVEFQDTRCWVNARLIKPVSPLILLAECAE